jgi:lipoprotein-anchoring transpeptidase ErfK/SrfK
MSRLKVGLTAVAVTTLIVLAPKILIAADTPNVASPTVIVKADAGSKPVAATVVIATAPASAQMVARVEPKLIAAPVEVPVARVAEPAAAPIAVSTALASTASTASVPVAETAAPVAKIAPPTPPKPETTLAIDIDLTRQHMTLTERGLVVGSWPISSGREGFRSPTGTFRPLWMSKMWFSKKYDNAPMPNAVFFSGGVAMHATQAVGMLGRPASHGCIRQSPANSATTFKLVQKHGNAHTKIIVHGSPRDSEPRVARRDRSSDPRLAARDVHRLNAAPASVGTRRVMLVDASGNRRVAEISANDPRLIAYQRRTQQVASAPRAEQGQPNGYYGRNTW